MGWEVVDCAPLRGVPRFRLWNGRFEFNTVAYRLLDHPYPYALLENAHGDPDVFCFHFVDSLSPEAFPVCYSKRDNFVISSRPLSLFLFPDLSASDSLSFDLSLDDGPRLIFHKS